MYLHCFKISPYKICNCKEKNSNFTVKEPGRHHPNQTITSNGTNIPCASCYDALRTHHCYSTPAKNTEPASNYEKISTQIQGHSKLNKQKKLACTVQKHLCHKTQMET